MKTLAIAGRFADEPGNPTQRAWGRVASANDWSAWLHDGRATPQSAIEFGQKRLTVCICRRL